MKVADYIAETGLSVEVVSVDPVNAAKKTVKVARGGRAVEMPLEVGEGKTFTPEAFVTMLRGAFTTLESVERSDDGSRDDIAADRAKVHGLPDEAKRAFVSLRDKYRDLVGPTDYRRLLDEVEA